LATFNSELSDYLNKNHKNITKLFTINFHKILPNIKQVFIKMKGRDRLKELLNMVKERDSGGENVEEKKTIIFCNTIKSCQAVDYYLKENSIIFSTLYSDMGKNEKKESFIKFRDGETDILLTYLLILT
jgi:ATP-dependent RNA helicase DDX28